MKKIKIVFEKREINWSIVLFDSALHCQNLCWKNKQKAFIPEQAKLRINRINLHILSKQVTTTQKYSISIFSLIWEIVHAWIYVAMSLFWNKQRSSGSGQSLKEALGSWLVVDKSSSLSEKLEAFRRKMIGGET